MSASPDDCHPYARCCTPGPAREMPKCWLSAREGGEVGNRATGVGRLGDYLDGSLNVQIADNGQTAFNRRWRPGTAP
jgi:hypothetical protein